MEFLNDLLFPLDGKLAQSVYQESINLAGSSEGPEIRIRVLQLLMSSSETDVAAGPHIV